jgi:hypothetical protein
MMGGKYSAEWWEKITDISRETTAQPERSHLVDDLIQATANGKRSRARKSEKARPEFASLEPDLP